MKFIKIYKIDFGKIIREDLPNEWKTASIIEWLVSIVAPIKHIYGDFLRYRKKTIYRLSHNSQVCYVQAVLNDAFDKYDRRIYITNGIFLEPLYVYTPEEERPVYIGKQHIYSDQDLQAQQTDFIVNVPADIKPTNQMALQGIISDMKAVINEYKLASKTYIIQWIK